MDRKYVDNGYKSEREVAGISDVISGLAAVSLPPVEAVAEQLTLFDAGWLADRNEILERYFQVMGEEPRP